MTTRDTGTKEISRVLVFPLISYHNNLGNICDGHEHPTEEYTFLHGASLSK